MPWKMKDNALVVENGNPVWVDDEGKDKVINGGDVLAKITQLSGEAAQNRRDAQAAQKALKDFEGIDAVAARDALDKISKIDQGQLIAAGKVDEVRNAITAQFTKQLETKDNELKTLSGQLHSALIGNAFANSAATKDKFTLPPDMLVKLFGDAFSVQDGKIVAKGPDGNIIMSGKNYGQPADFDEAFTSIIDKYPGKDAILRGTNHNGTGGTGGAGGQGGKRRLTRSEEAALSIADKAAFMKEVREGKAELVDNV